MTTKLGLNAKAYRNTGTYGTPTWVEMSNIRDANLNDAMSEADVTRRASGGWREMEPTIREVSFEYDAVNIDADAEVLAITAAHAARTSLDIAILDGPVATAGSEGVRGHFKVFSRNRAEELENAQMLSFVFKPCQGEEAMVRMLVE
jgi:hypothetical protein